MRTLPTENSLLKTSKGKDLESASHASILSAFELMQRAGKCEKSK